MNVDVVFDLTGSLEQISGKDSALEARSPMRLAEALVTFSALTNWLRDCWDLIRVVLEDKVESRSAILLIPTTVS